MSDAFNVLDKSGMVLAIEDRKGSFTAGGVATAGIWTPRDLNTIVTNNINATLNSNAFSLPKGNYYAMVNSPFYRVRRARVKLWDTISNANILMGSNGFCSVGDGTQIIAIASGNFTLTENANLNLRYFVEDNGASNNALGISAIAGGASLYSTVQIWAV